MKTSIYILIAALLLTVAGCDKSTENSDGENAPASEATKDESPPSPPTAEPGRWRIGTVDVRAGQAPDALDMPSSETVSTWLEAAVAEATPLEMTDRNSSAFVTYQAAVVDGVSGVPAEEQPFLRVRVQGRLEDPERPESVNKLMALGIERRFEFDGENGQPSTDKLQEWMRQVIEEYVRAVARRFEALSASEAELVALLESNKLPPEAELTAIHEARDREVEDAVRPIAELLGHESPSIVVAAAAALSQMAPEETAGQIVEAAGRLGREREYASLHRLIFIVGDLDQPVAREYLEGLTGHQIPDIRRAAEQALESSPSDESRGQP